MIPKRDLGNLVPIAKGGVGQVYGVPGFTLPGLPELAYKELLPTLKPADRQRALHSMIHSVAFRAGLPPADRDDLDEYTTWPVEVVEDDAGPCGLLMPLIPADFFITTNPPGTKPGRLVFDLSWLCAKDSQAQVNGIDRSGITDPLVRLALLAQLVYAVGRLHKHGAVYGDISLKNAALAVNPPRVKLLDCDAAAALSDQSRDQLHSPFFQPPEILSGSQRLQDDRTDVYKLGLCVVRGLQQGRGVSQVKTADGLAGVLDASTVDVVRRAVGQDPARRPPAKELFEALKSAILAKANPPVIHSASLSHRTLLRGFDLRVSWASTGGREVRLLGPNGLDLVMPDPGVSPAHHVLQPTSSGEIVVRVSNQHGTVETTAGTVQLYELPAFHVDVSAFPRPVLSALPPVTLPTAARQLPTVPAVSTAAHPVPRLVTPAMDAVVDALRPLRTVPSPFDRLDAAVADVGRAAPGPLDVQAGSRLRSAGEDAGRRARRLVDEALDAMSPALRREAERALRAATNPAGGTP